MLFYPTSLEKMCESYKLKIKKTIFPYNFPNENNLNYIGEIPD
jgi:hypothetical protein